MKSEFAFTAQDFRWRIEPDICLGEVTYAELDCSGVNVSGWVKALPRATGRLKIIAVSGGMVLPECNLTSFEKDGTIEFAGSVPVTYFRPRLIFDVEFLAIDTNGLGAKLPLTGHAGFLERIKVNNGDGLLELIHYGNRFNDPKLLFFISFHSLEPFKGDFVATAVAIVVMGYRIIEGLEIPKPVRAVFDKKLHELLVAPQNVTRGHWLRWNTSLKLMAGYLAYQEGRRKDAIKYFENVADFAFDLKYWPSSLTNILIGIFLSGWILYQDGEFESACRSWGRAEGVLRAGLALATLENFYAYGESGKAIEVARECFVGYLQAKNKGRVVTDPNLLPHGYQLDIAHLPALVANLGLKNG